MTERLKPSAIHPELRGVFRFVPNPPIQRGWMLNLMQSAGGISRAPKLPDGMTHGYVELGPGAGAHVYGHLRASADGGPRPALMWIHGGGMVLGNAAADHQRCISTAAELDIVVVSADYRLAPQHPYPAALDDCHTVWAWTVANAAVLGVDVARLAIGGQSAGGGLTASLVQRLHDEGGPQPVAQWLFCPMLDDRTAARQELDDARNYLWNNRANRVGWGAYLGMEPGSPDVPAAAVPARRADLKGLPAAWIGTGDIDLFYDEDCAYADALTAAGVPCELDVVAGGPHAFETLVPKSEVSRGYMTRAYGWLAGQLGLPADHRR